MPSILDTILKRKREEVTARQRRRPLAALQEVADVQPSVRGFQRALRARLQSSEIAVIAEIKKASPSAGVIREDFQPAVIAGQYQAAGATCLSVLTDEHFFQGRDQYLRMARDACRLPILRKDFIIDPYQLVEARAIGADAVLLIAAALEGKVMRELFLHARELELDVLLEVHDAAELQRVLELQTLTDELMIGINNRDLRRFITDLDVSRKLAPRIPSRHLLISESGIHQRSDIDTLRSHGLQAFLVGEALLRQADPGLALLQLLATPGGSIGQA